MSKRSLRAYRGGGGTNSGGKLLSQLVIGTLAEWAGAILILQKWADGGGGGEDAWELMMESQCSVVVCMLD